MNHTDLWAITYDWQIGMESYNLYAKYGRNSMKTLDLNIELDSELDNEGNRPLNRIRVSR